MELSVTESLVPTIQLSITPVILITGLGSLLLTMTNRMGRVVDRTRILAGQARAANDGERRHIEDQLKIMYRRSKIVRLSVTLGAGSMFCSGLLVIAIFASGVLGSDLAGVILGAVWGEHRVVARRARGVFAGYFFVAQRARDGGRACAGSPADHVIKNSAAPRAVRFS